VDVIKARWGEEIRKEISPTLNFELTISLYTFPFAYLHVLPKFGNNATKLEPNV